MIFLYLSLGLPPKIGDFSATITWQSSRSGTHHSTWKEMQEMVLATIGRAAAGCCSLATKRHLKMN